MRKATVARIFILPIVALSAMGAGYKCLIPDGGGVPPARFDVTIDRQFDFAGRYWTYWSFDSVPDGGAFKYRSMGVEVCDFGQTDWDRTVERSNVAVLYDWNTGGYNTDPFFSCNVTGLTLWWFDSYVWRNGVREGKGNPGMRCVELKPPFGDDWDGECNLSVPPNPTPIPAEW